MKAITKVILELLALFKDHTRVRHEEQILSRVQLLVNIKTSAWVYFPVAAELCLCAIWLLAIQTISVLHF